MKISNTHISVKIVLLVLGVLCCVQTLTFFILGKSSIMTTYFETFQSGNTHSGVVGILDPGEQFSESSRDAIRKSMNTRYSEVQFINDSLEWQENFWDNEEKLALKVSVVYEPLFSATVWGANGSIGYAESWKTQYFWCLITWVEISKESLGQS